MQVQILDEKSCPLPATFHEGSLFVRVSAANPRSGSATPRKQPYSIRLRNDSPRTKMAVVSVDGINVIDGKDAATDGPGYVLSPWETLDIQGWCRGGDKAARFEFQPEHSSYASQMGKGTANVGVIGVAVFGEKAVTYRPSYPVNGVTPAKNPASPSPWGEFPNPTPYWNMLGGTASGVQLTRSCGEGTLHVPMSTSPATKGVTSYHYGPPADVGTGYGAEVDFHTTEVPFIRASSVPEQTIVLRYATKARLQEWGIPVEPPPKKEPFAANPFPAQRAGVPAPPGWMG